MGVKSGTGRPWHRPSPTRRRPPRALVLLGATAGQALLGPSFKLGEAQGRRLDSDLAEHVTATAHPSAILRARDHDARETMRATLAGDLREAASFLAACR